MTWRDLKVVVTGVVRRKAHDQQNPTYDQCINLMETLQVSSVSEASHRTVYRVALVRGEVDDGHNATVPKCPQLQSSQTVRGTGEEGTWLVRVSLSWE